MIRGPNVARTCVQCGASFLAWPYNVRNGRAICCSRSCANKRLRNVVGRKLIEQNSIPEPNSGCWLWTGAYKKGYGVVGISRKSWQAHRLSYLVFGGVLLADDMIMHSCDNPWCVNPEHLKAGTHADNMQDAVSKGRMPRGSSKWTAVLKETQIPEIRRKLARGETQTSIGAEYGVDPSTVRLIARGKTWGWL